jgi:cytidine diphosphoramidate kinase
MVIWITGLSGSGKTTIAHSLYNKVKSIHPNTVLLDGDIIRKALNHSWGYSTEERLKGAKHVAGLCAMLDNDGQNVICATMSLFHEIQESNRERFSSLTEVYLDVTMHALRQRDKKGLYSGVEKGTRNNVVGLDLPFEIPKNPEFFLENDTKFQLVKNIETLYEYIIENISPSFSEVK